jgi:hypothetical protein
MKDKWISVANLVDEIDHEYDFTIKLTNREKEETKRIIYKKMNEYIEQYRRRVMKEICTSIPNKIINELELWQDTHTYEWTLHEQLIQLYENFTKNTPK